MSTKSSMVYDDDFHFYHELGDDRHVYLELRDTHFQAGYNRVMVPIPVHIWEVIRHEGGVDLSLADQTEAELEAHASEQVDRAIAEYEKYKDTPMRGLYVSAERPREEQIAEALEELEEERRTQQEIRAAIEAIRAKNRRLFRRETEQSA